MKRLLLAALLLGCPSEPVAPEPTPAAEASQPDLTATCCAQCDAAAGQDPQAMDLTLVPCASYAGRVVNGKPALDAACGAWFSANPRTVGECSPPR